MYSRHILWKLLFGCAGKWKFPKQRNFVFITQMNLQTFPITNFIVPNRSFIFIGFENERFSERWPFVLLLQKERNIRRQLQSLYLVYFQPRSQQIQPSDHLFVFAEILWTIGEYQVTLIPMNIMHSQCVANALNHHLCFLKIVYLSDWDDSA